jgi:hypothetical protein
MRSDLSPSSADINATNQIYTLVVWQYHYCNPQLLLMIRLPIQEVYSVKFHQLYSVNFKLVVEGSKFVLKS